jgi:hypothetical protein
VHGPEREVGGEDGRIHGGRRRVPLWLIVDHATIVADGRRSVKTAFATSRKGGENWTDDRREGGVAEGRRSGSKDGESDAAAAIVESEA